MFIDVAEVLGTLYLFGCRARMPPSRTGDMPVVRSPRGSAPGRSPEYMFIFVDPRFRGDDRKAPVFHCPKGRSGGIIPA